MARGGASKLGTLVKEVNWLIGALVTLVFLALFLSQFGFLATLENKLYDTRLKFFGRTDPGNEIAIVAIDDESILKIGRWPWPRSHISELINLLTDYEAKAIGVSILFTEPENNTGLETARFLQERFEASGLRSAGAAGEEFFALLTDIELELDNDAKLVGSTELAGNVVLPMYFSLSRSMMSIGTEEGLEVPPYLADEAIKQVENAEYLESAALFRATDVVTPIERLGAAAKAIGHSNVLFDPDGISRQELLVVEYGGKLYPSFPLQLAREYLGASKEKMRLVVGKGVAFDSYLIPTDDQMRMFINYYGPNQTFPYYSFYDVVNEKISPAAFKNKIVLVGATAEGMFDNVPTPFSPVFPGTERCANVVSTIVHGSSLSRPSWAWLFEIGMILLLGLATAFVLPRLHARAASLATIGILVAYIAFTSISFGLYGWWINMIYPVMVVAINYVAIISRQYLTVEREKVMIEEESDEANKMLGLTFQGKGMLDLAFEKFAKVPVNDEMKEILYNLGLDFERKRQSSKALRVYERIRDADGEFRDVVERIERLATMADAPVAISFASRPDATVIVEGLERPTLGRYEIAEELGRGAMGIVYKGRDPKINREVAIKAVHFDEFDESEVQAIRDRFFREAESAGTLSHPNIVTIYDVGEEMDLAYIAMELLDGHDLQQNCRKPNLLPLRRALEITVKAAAALAYAHQHGIVHRDIKPANMMILSDGELKITDFGIAQLQSAHQTKTGVIMGTPNYMSPEQISGQVVDGRSDLWSLGIMLYQLLTGELPFKGDTLASLMYQITSAPPTPLQQHNQQLPAYLEKIIRKALAKKPEQRFQDGSELAKYLTAFLAKLDQALAERAK